MFDEELQKLNAHHLLRTIMDRGSSQGRQVAFAGASYLNFSSNDYLGLANHPQLREAAVGAIASFGTGGGASRLLGGGTIVHKALEEKLASFKKTGSALLFTSGYAANVGIIPALAAGEDAILSDELNHASIIDGCRLSRAQTKIYRHRDPEHLEFLLRDTRARRKVVVTDSVFSMDGDIAPLPDIVSLCRKYEALLFIDDAHGTGVLGNGRGALAHFGIAPEPSIIQMGTFSKALGSLGGFVAASEDVIMWLKNSARSMIFSTALPAHVVAASLAALALVEKDTALIRQLHENRTTLYETLRAWGIDTGNSETPIVPVMCERSEEAVALSERLFAEGIYAPAIRPPTVLRPRLRITVTAAHKKEDLDRLSGALRKHVC